MLMSVAVSVVEQWIGEDVCELKAEFDDADEEFKKEKEKDIYTIDYLSFAEVKTYDYQSSRNLFSIKNEKLNSELFYSLPELPPKLECGFQPA
jgi:hypothetical protein